MNGPDYGYMSKLVSAGLLVILLTVALLGCGDNVAFSLSKPVACSTSYAVDGSVLITCPDGTLTVISQGVNGIDGVDGLNGSNALVSSVTPWAGCTNGGSLLLAGTDLDNNSVLDPSEITASLDVCNGQDGVDAPQPQFTPVAVITPCGPNSSSYKEVLLGLFGGGIFASFSGSSSALLTRNVLLPDGNFTNTDNSACPFNISTAVNGDRTVSWAGGGSSYTASTSSWLNF